MISICVTMENVLFEAQNNLRRIEQMKRREIPYPWNVSKIIKLASKTIGDIGEVIKLYRMQEWRISDPNKLLAAQLLMKLENIRSGYPSKIVRYFTFFICCGECEKMHYSYRPLSFPENKVLPYFYAYPTVI